MLEPIDHGHYSNMLTLKILESGCRDLLHFSHKSISEVGLGSWVIRPGHFIPKVLDRIEVLIFNMRALFCCNGNWPFPNCWRNAGSTHLSELCFPAWNPGPSNGFKRPSRDVNFFRLSSDFFSCTFYIFKP